MVSEAQDKDICEPTPKGMVTPSTAACFVDILTFLTLMFFFRPQKKETEMKEPLRERFLKLDPIRYLLVIAGVNMLLQSVQWSVINMHCPKVRSSVSLWVPVSCQSFSLHGSCDDALTPPKVVSQHTVAASFLMGFFLSGVLLVESYYLPYWFRVIDSAAP